MSCFLNYLFLHVKPFQIQMEHRRGTLLHSNNTEGLVHYNMPVGHRFNRKVSLQDEVYDGEVLDGWMRGGLGQLVDERLGRWNLRNGGVEWVGWRKEAKNDVPDAVKALQDARGFITPYHSKESSFMKNKNDFFYQKHHFNPNHLSYQKHHSSINETPVIINFKFDGVRNFSEVRLHVNNDPSKHIRSFSRCRVEFSLDDSHWLSKHRVDFSGSPQKRVERARWIKVDLMGKLARYVRVALWFEDDWLMLSEVHFLSCESLVLVVCVGSFW